jgi:Tol biopolymer transport system component
VQQRHSPTTRPRLLLQAFLWLILAGSWPCGAATRYDPRLTFRTLHTAHFDIHAHQGEAALARRLADIAEHVRDRLAPELGTVDGRVQVVLVNQSDLSNGWSTPVPYDEIEITAHPPAEASFIGNETDWLQLVFTHEYTHVLHLDRSGGFMRGLRRVFGRVPLAFPNLFLPQWQIEGIATYEESRGTGRGRLAAGDFRSIVDTAARAGRFEPLDRASGGLADWPGGNAAYAYGASFHQFLADRYGPERLATLSDATAGRLPFFGSGAFRRVYGTSLGTLWQQFARSHRDASSSPSHTDENARRLTLDGFFVGALATDGRDIYYSSSNANGYPALMRVEPGQEPARVAWRFAGEGTTTHGDWVVFDQVSPVRAVAWYSDLYAVRREGGGVHRLTDDARAAEPAFSPDGRELACTIDIAGRRALAVLPFDIGGASRPRPLVFDAGADFGAPKWSPDGRAIVAERRRRDGFDLVTIDPRSGELHVVLTAPVRLMTPSWVDATTVVFAADLKREAVNVFAADLPTGAISRVTDSRSGASMPHLTASGRLVYVGYTDEGFDVFSVPTDRRTWQPVAAGVFSRPAADEVSATPAAAPSDVESPAPSQPYSPWRTLRPTYWTPVIASGGGGEVIVGAGTAMTDALGRHSYAASIGWSTRVRPDWQIEYAYDRWRPTFFVSYSDNTDPVRGGAVRSRQLAGGALLTIRALRRSDTFFGGVDGERDNLSCNGPCRVRVTEADRVSTRAGWLHDTRRAFAYSISTEEGYAVTAAVEASAVSPDQGWVHAAVLDARGFEPIGRTHAVIALRVASALAWGPTRNRRVFSAAGAGPAVTGFDFGRGTVGLLRGFAEDDVVGTRAAVVNADARFPLLRLERGHGTLPVFVRAVHGAVFTDAGTAWDGTFRTSDVRTSTGAELAADLVLGHSLALTVAAGGAWTRDPVRGADGSAIFARIGHAF